MEGGKRKQSKISFGICVVMFFLLLAFAYFLFERGFISEDIFLSDPENIVSISENEAEIGFIDLWQSESIMIKSAGRVILIDSGEIGYGDDIKAFLRARKIKRIDLFVLTHPHSDHIGSAVSVFDNFDVKEVLIPDIPAESLPDAKLYEDFLIAAEKEGSKLMFASPGMTYKFENGGTFTVLGPVSDYGTDYNNWSIVSKFSLGDISFLFTGDQESIAEADLLNSGADVSCDVLKIGHHGSGSSSSSEFLDATAPEYAVIFCGKNNDYGHPHNDTVSALSKRNIKVLRTDLDGDISFITDGKGITATTENGYILMGNIQNQDAKKSPK